MDKMELSILIKLSQNKHKRKLFNESMFDKRQEQLNNYWASLKQKAKQNYEKNKELDEAFFEEWADKFRALKNLIPNTENNFTGKGKEKKFKAEFRRKGNLLLTILKTLN